MAAAVRTRAASSCSAAARPARGARRDAVGDGAGRGARAAARRSATARSATSSSRARRTARSTTTSATRRRCRRRGFGPPPGYTQPDAAGGTHAPFHLTALTSPDPPHRWDAVHEQYDGGRMDGFYVDRAGRRRRRQRGDPLLHGRRAAVLLQPVRPAGLCANYFCSVLGPTLAEPLLPDVRHLGRDHDERAVGLRDLRLGQRGRSSSTCSTTPASPGRSTTSASTTSDRRQRQRRRVLEPLGARPAHDRDEGRLPRRLPPGGCRRSRG